jgi:hypothetical protein
MKKHVTYEDDNAWARWKNVNLNVSTKDDQCQKNSKHRFIVGYGAITNHFGNTTPYKEDLGFSMPFLNWLPKPWKNLWCQL